MTGTLSLLGLYQYNEQLFDGLRLPDGINRETFVDNLLAECAEFEVLYPDPFFLANMIAVWSNKEFPTWEKLYNTTMLDYDPISNYDRKEEWEDDVNSSGNSTGKIAGFNSQELVNANGAETVVENKSKRKGRAYGNIGVTTTQQMIDEERRVVKFNISDYIIESFKRRFCLLIY